MNTLPFQLQRRLPRVAAEELRIVDVVAAGVIPGVLHRLGDYLHADDLSCRLRHDQRDGAHAAVQVQHCVRLGDLRLGNGQLIQMLGLAVIDLIKRAGGQAENKATQRILNIAGAVKRDKAVPQHGVPLPFVDGQYQGRKARDLFQPIDQDFRMGKGFPVYYQAHQNLAGNSAPADIDMPQKPLVGSLVINGDMKLVYITDNNIPNGVAFLREDPAAVHFHHVMGACPKESSVSPSLFDSNRVLGLVPVAKAGRRGQDGHFFQGFPADPIQAGADPLCF